MNLEIIKIASKSKNNNLLEDFTDKFKKKNPICGDEIEISFKIKNKKILDIGYKSKSCIYCEASASLLSEKCKKKSITKIKNLVETVENFFEDPSTKFPKEWNGFIKVINKDNISRKQCLVLPFNVLSKLIKNYE